MSAANEQTGTTAWARREALIEQFEAAFLAGQRPVLEAFLPVDPAHRRAVLIELVHAELELRLKAGEAAGTDDYLQRFPELAADPEVARALRATEARFRGDKARAIQAAARRPAADAALPTPEGTGRAGFGETPTTVVMNPGQAAPPGEAAPAGGRYHPLRLHAQGGLGEVWVARDSELSRDVALKRIRRRYAADADCRRRFLREGEITGNLEHPGVVPVHGMTWDVEGQPCYVMRFIRGQTLKEAIERYHASPGKIAGWRCGSW